MFLQQAVEAARRYYEPSIRLTRKLFKRRVHTFAACGKSTSKCLASHNSQEAY